MRDFDTRWRGLGCVLAAALLLAPAARAADADDPVVAQRGTVVLRASDVRQLIEMADPEAGRQMRRDPAVLAQNLRDRLLQLSILADAKAHQWEQRPDVAWRAEQARDAVIEESYVAAQIPADPAFPSDAQIQAAYDANKAKLIAPRQYHVAQIFVASPQSGTVETDAEALRRANDLRQQVVKQHADFAALAKAHSDDTGSAPNGGDLGWVREDGVIPAIRGVIASLPDGGVSDPVRSPQGWHIVKLLGTRPAALMPLADARDMLVRALRQERMVQAQRGYVSTLLQQTPIQLNEIELSKFATR